MRRVLFFYFVALTVPLFLGLSVWQFAICTDLKREIRQIENAQIELVERNKQLITDIAALSSPQRIAYIAQNDLDLRKIRPEDVLQIKIEGRKGRDL